MMLYKKYLKLLQWLCRKEMLRITDKYPMSLDDLIAYHDFMAIQCIDNNDSRKHDRVLGVSVSTARMLEGITTKQ